MNLAEGLDAPNNKENTPIYSQNMLAQLTDDNAGITYAKNPSNLTEVPKINEKYEIQSFVQVNPQYRANLKTMEILKNNASG